VGSSPTASASRTWGHGPTGRRWFRIPEIRVRLPVTPLEIMVPWSSGEDAWPTSRKPMVRFHPGPLICPSTPTGRAAWLKPRRLPVRPRPWARLGRQSADHPRLERRMLRVRLPPEPLQDRSPCGAARSARLPVTQEVAGSSPVEGAETTVRYANRQSGEVQTFVICGFDSRLHHWKPMRRLGIGKPNWP
jgi:hypothetical protein